MTSMPFGKFKGQAISELPDYYLLWITENLDLREPLRGYIFAEIKSRGGPAVVGDVTLRVPAPDVAMVREIIDRGVRASAKVHHPDLGGDPKVMVRLNNVSAALRSQLATIGSAT